jgi:hypothetical protein
MKKFECHLTFHVDHAAQVRAAGDQYGWKFSQIDGDPLMGAKPFCYLTSYHSDGEELLSRARRISKDLQHPLVKVETLRLKIEEIVFDTKTMYNVLTT